MRRFAGWFGILLLSAASACRSWGDDFVKPDEQGVLRLAGKTEQGKPLQVQISLRASNSTDRDEARGQEKDGLASDWWGADTGAPRAIISTFEVKIAGEFVPLFRSAYGDLADVRSAQIATTKSGFTLTIAGGETGTGYVARLRFKDGYLIGREVTHNEMGLEERTEYFPIRDN